LQARRQPVADHRIRYAHFVWHLFVMGGCACHFFAALWHANVPA
jgi:hemolysin III